MGSQVEPARNRAPTLYGIIVFKLGKGSLLLVLAITLFCLSDNNLPEEYNRFLDLLGAHPRNQFFANLAQKVGQITESGMLWAAGGTLFYALFSLVEGIGLTFRVSWAGWMAIGESGFFIPIEIYELVRPGPTSWTLLIVLVINIIIVWYLVQNRHRLFRHHVHGAAHPSAAEQTPVQSHP